MKSLMHLAMIAFFALSCKKSETKTPARIKVDEVTSLKAFAGRDRVMLSCVTPAANNIKICRVSWNDGKDSLDVPITDPGTSTGILVEHLDEGSYRFLVGVLDDRGNASPGAQVTGHAYGKKYADSLHNRYVVNAVYNPGNGSVDISWDQAAEGALGTEIKYKDSLGNPQNLFVPAFQTKTAVPGGSRAKDSLFLYRTRYLPEPLAIDTFLTAYDTLHPDHPAEASWDPSYTRTILKADGPGDTYELIDHTLGGTAEETPDCADPSFGRHIREQYDDVLKENVFAFYLHVTPDNDRCINFDRQRCEIKTYGPSPDSMKAFNGDEMIFQWKFKLADGFQPSKSFTHIHQIKAGDGPNDGSPLITITPRYGNPDQLQIIHTGDSKSSTLGTVTQVDLAPFKGTWVQAIEKIKFGSHGTYSLVLKKVSDGTVLLSYSNQDIDLWRTGSSFIRPKWGIYRSLNDAGHLRDEIVLFADFNFGKKR